MTEDPTLGEFADDHDFHAMCASCQHGQTLDTESLLRRFGPDRSLRRLYVTCPNCGAPDNRVYVSVRRE